MIKLNNRGFTLVEALTAGVIAAIAIVSLVALIMTGRQIDTADKHRRQARAVIMDTLESPAYSYINYTLPQLTDGTTNSTVTIDPRNGTPLTGTLSVAVNDSTINAVPFKEITMTVSWTEVSGGTQSVRLTKWLCQVQ
jgi:Tfp pilus assembly protein PilV